MIQSIQKNVMWRAIPVAGLAGGTAFLAVNLLLTPLILEINAGVVLRYIASILLGPDALTDTSSGVLLTGVVVNYALSMPFALVIAIVIHRWGLGVGIFGGALLGLILWGINLYSMTTFFEWFFAINNRVLIVSHVVFGAVAGGVYEMLDTYDVPLIGGEEATHAE